MSLMPNLKMSVLCIFLLFGQGCTHLDIRGDVVNQGLTKSGKSSCFPNTLTTKKNAPFYCEASAVAYHDGKVYVASDKNVASPRSSFFMYRNIDSLDEVDSYLTGAVFAGVRKVEDMAVDRENQLIFATTSFDRIKEKSHKWDPYNTLFAFKPDDVNSVFVVNEEITDGYVSSLSVKQLIEDAVGSKYFKVEGLAVLPGNKIVFGIREQGQTYKDFRYVSMALVGSFVIRDSKIFMTEKLEILFDYTEDVSKVKNNLGLSSLTYNSYDHSLFMTTSYEENEVPTIEGLGAYLWKVSLSENSRKAKKLMPVLNSEGEMHRFTHKSEGIAIIDKNRLLVVHDDDRVLQSSFRDGVSTKPIRQPSEFFYDVVQF